MTTSSKTASTPLFTSAQAYAVKTPPRKVKKSTDLGTELQARFFEYRGHYIVIGIILLVFILSTCYGGK